MIRVGCALGCVHNGLNAEWGVYIMGCSPVIKVRQDTCNAIVVLLLLVISALAGVENMKKLSAGKECVFAHGVLKHHHKLRR